MLFKGGHYSVVHLLSSFKDEQIMINSIVYDYFCANIVIVVEFMLYLYKGAVWLLFYCGNYLHLSKECNILRMHPYHFSSFNTLTLFFNLL